MSERIKGFISEVGKIDAEIKRLNAQKRKLHDRKKDLERRILAFLEKNEQAGVKYRGTAVIAKDRVRRGRRKKKDQEKDSADILKKYGIRNSDQVAKEILEAIKGEAKDDKVLKITKY